MNRISLKLLVAVCILALLASCSEKAVYDQVRSFESNEWGADHPLEFKVAINDTSRSYDLLLHVRTTKTYAYSNIWLFLETTAPSGQTLTDTLEVMLADENGKWLGKGFGNVNSMLVPYLTSVKFINRGVYSISIAQGMREEILTDVLDIGLVINYSDQ